MRIQPEKIKNILCVRNDRFGEFLLNIPALRALKETFAGAKITMAIDPYLEDLAKSIPLIDEIIKWEGLRHSLFQKLGLVSLLKKKNMDMAVILNPSKEFNIITYLAGIPVRVGYARKWGFLLTHAIEDKKYLGKMHEIEYNLELVSLIGASTESKALSLNIDERIGNSLLKDYNIKNDDILVALHPWTSDPVKLWPLERFQEVAHKLTQELNIKVLVVGGKMELDKGKGLFGEEGKLINMTGKTTLSELAAFLKRCNLLISGDSGPVHLACAVGTPVLALFRNDLPGKTAKRWGPWGGANLVIEKDSLYGITVDEVMDKAREILKR